MEIFEHFLDIPVMFGHVIGVDKYIIQIYYNTNIQKIRKEVVHESLKGHRSISQIKEYYKSFK